MEPYRMRNGETYGEETPEAFSPLPPDTSTTGQRFRQRARLAKKVPNWRDLTPAQKDNAIRLAAIDEANDRRRREGR